MAIFRCKMCGGDLEVNEGINVLECEYCGTSQTVPTANNEKKVNLFNRANRLRMSNEFDKAAGVYESIAAEFPEEAEAYWGLCLCKYGIEYVDDPATAKKIPTCHRTSFDSIFNDSNFELAQEYSDAVAVNIYRNEAKEIDRIQKSILEIAQKEDPFDIFICYKETAEDGQRTKDSVLAQDIYDTLTSKGYKVFFSRITLEDKLGQQYEPYIFSALNSAKVMLAIGTKYEYYNAVWVKNEWGRYLDLMKKDKEKVLIPCYTDIDAYDMPQEFQNLQGQDMGKVGFIQDLVRGIGKIIPLANETQNVQVVQQVVTASNSNIENLLKRGNLALEDKKWDKAANFFEQVLNENAEESRAYFGMLLVECELTSESELIQHISRINVSDNYKKAYRFSDDNFKRKLDNINNQITYNIAYKHMSSAKTGQDFLTAKSEFESISGFFDADSKAAECDEKAKYTTYQDALKLGQSNLIADVRTAISKLESIIDYKDSKELIDKFNDNIKHIIKTMQQEGTNTIAINMHSVGIKSDGTVVATGNNDKGQCNVSDWKDIVSVSVVGNSTIGVKSDGTVVSTNPQYNVSGWRNIVSVSPTRNHIVGVKSDGTVVAIGENDKGQCNVSNWKDIVAVSTGSKYTIGLKSDGTVVAVGENKDGQCNISDWKNIVAISAGWAHTVGLKSDGTVVATGKNDSGQCNVSNFTKIAAVVALSLNTVALKADGTVVAVGLKNECLSLLKTWSDIVAINGVDMNMIIGLKTNGVTINNSSAFDGPIIEALYDIKMNINPRLNQYIRDKAADKANNFSLEDQKRAWRNNDVCQHCGGNFKISLFIKKCSVCGKIKDY